MYYIAKDRFGDYDLAHAGQWSNHKYIRKEGNRYIYPDDLKKVRKATSVEQARSAINAAQERGLTRTKKEKAKMASRVYQERGMALTNKKKAKEYAKRSAESAAERGKKQTMDIMLKGFDKAPRDMNMRTIYTKDGPIKVGSPVNGRQAMDYELKTRKDYENPKRKEAAKQKVLASVSKEQKKRVRKAKMAGTINRGKRLLSNLFSKKKK